MLVKNFSDTLSLAQIVFLFLFICAVEKKSHFMLISLNFVSIKCNMKSLFFIFIS